MKRVVVTGGAGQIAYSLLFRIAAGELFGKEEPFALHILELSEMTDALKAVKMELEDCAFPQLREIVIGSDPLQLFSGVTHAFLVGAKPRGPGMERSDLLNENSKIFIEQGRALNQAADPNVKVLVVGNPCNTNCWIAMENAPKIPKLNFHAMTRLDQNRAVYQLANKAKVPVTSVSRMTIWGNHSTTQVPDFLNARIGGKPVTQVIPDRKWLEGEFITTVQKRGATVIQLRGKSSAASAATAALDAMRSIINPTPEGEWYSSGIYAKDNPYGITEDLIFSFPIRTTGNGTIEIVSDLKLDAFLTERLKASEKELLEERELVSQLAKLKNK